MLFLSLYLCANYHCLDEWIADLYTFFFCDVDQMSSFCSPPCKGSPSHLPERQSLHSGLIGSYRPYMTRPFMISLTLSPMGFAFPHLFQSHWPPCCLRTHQLFFCLRVFVISSEIYMIHSIFPSLLFWTALLRQNLHVIKFTCFKFTYTLQAWHRDSHL